MYFVIKARLKSRRSLFGFGQCTMYSSKFRLFLFFSIHMYVHVTHCSSSINDLRWYDSSVIFPKEVEFLVIF